MQTQLVLRTADIPSYENNGTTLRATYTNNFPTYRINAFSNEQYEINVNQTKMKFKNINLRSILGSEYDDDQVYCLQLVSITFGLTSNGSTYSANEQDRTFNVVITSGFPFLHQYATNQETTDTSIATLRVPNGTSSNIYSFINKRFFFKTNKNYSFSNIQIGIEYRDIESNVLQPSSGVIATNYPNATFVFSIYKV
jgi:hypothetical protein